MDNLAIFNIKIAFFVATMLYLSQKYGKDMIIMKSISKIFTSSLVALAFTIVPFIGISSVNAEVIEATTWAELRKCMITGEDTNPTCKLTKNLSNSFNFLKKDKENFIIFLIN